MAVSNFAEKMDAALRRPGRRPDRHVALNLPDRSARQQMLELYLGEDIEKEREIIADGELC